MNVYIFSIQRARRRQDMCMGSLLEKGVPHNKIRPFYGPDHTHFVDIDMLCNAAVADGFLGAEKLERCSIAVAAQMWGYFQFFRLIQESDQCALYLHDDAYLNLQYWHYKQICTQLYRHDPEFKFLGLTTTALAKSRDVQFVMYHPVLKGIPTGMSDHAGIVSPKFLDWFVDRFLESETTALDQFFWQEYDPSIAGFYGMPAELSSQRFPVEAVPSLIFDSDRIIEENVYDPKRK